MLKRLNEKKKRVTELLCSLAEQSSGGALILVEGRKDMETLRSLRVEGPIISAKTGGKSYTQIMHEIEESNPEEVILMFDFDRRGKQATAQFTQGLEHAHIKANLKFWRTLSALLGREVQCIESLTSYLQTLEKKSTNM